MFTGLTEEAGLAVQASPFVTVDNPRDPRFAGSIHPAASQTRPALRAANAWGSDENLRRPLSIVRCQLLNKEHSSHCRRAAAAGRGATGRLRHPQRCHTRQPSSSTMMAA